MNFRWFRYVWIIILAIIYVGWTFITFKSGAESEKIGWTVGHLTAVMFGSLIYFLATSE